MTQKIRVGIVRLEFEAEFIRTYQACRNAEPAAESQCSQGPLNKVANRFGIAGRYSGEGVMLPDLDLDPDFDTDPDATTIATPMATTLEDCNRVVAAQVTSGTSRAYGRERSSTRDSSILAAIDSRRCVLRSSSVPFRQR